MEINNVYVEALVLEEAEFWFGCVASEVMVQQVENEGIMKILFLLLALLLFSLPASHLYPFIRQQKLSF